MLGFNEAGSNRIVDMTECHILHPALFDLLTPLRRPLASMIAAKRAAEVQLTLVARLGVDEGYGAETRFEPQPATVTLGGVSVGFPPGAFLQATADGEAALVEAVLRATAGALRTADLFAGLGTFALALQGHVTAAEASRDAVLALKIAASKAGRQVAAEHRDLYRRPFDAGELKSFDAVVLDPPRAGAEGQVRELAASSVPRIAYVSCNPATFARDAAVLASGGYKLDWVKAVGQFRWSTHVELAASFAR